MRLPLASVGQTGAASCAATSQDLAAIGSSHALAEPVDLGAMTLLRLIGTNHSDTPPVSISSGMQASANHNSRIAPAAVVKQMRDPCIHDYAKVIIAEKNCRCQPKISTEFWEISRFSCKAQDIVEDLFGNRRFREKFFLGIGHQPTQFVGAIHESPATQRSPPRGFALPARAPFLLPGPSLSTSEYIIHLLLWKKSDTIYYLRVPPFSGSRIPLSLDFFRDGTPVPLHRQKREKE